MGATYLGDINLPSVINVLKTMPIDTRTVVDSKDDLTSVGYPYPGLIVNIKGTNQLYVCINANGVTTTEDDWKLVIDADTINNTVNNAITWIELTD